MHRKNNRYFILIILALCIIATGTVLAMRHSDSPPTANTPNNKTNVTHAASPSPAVQSQSFDKKQYPLNDPSSPWVVVNKTRPLQPKTYAPGDLVAVGGGQVMRMDAASALSAMAAAAKSAGLTISAASAYRSYDTQVNVYNAEVKQYGQQRADSESARPGYSEHQTGWSVDIAGGGCSIEDCFANTAEGKWTSANAYKYGFILRYPSGKEVITGYRYEPWHFRYVGISLATEMHKQGIETLEEFFGLPAAPDYR